MMNLLFSTAHAQEAAAAAPAPQGGLMSFLPIILVFAVFYFLMIRPQKKKMQQEQQFISALKKGDEVYTKSGLLGKIYGMTDKVVTLELEEGTKVKYLRSHIAGAASTLFADPKANAKK